MRHNKLATSALIVALSFIGMGSEVEARSCFSGKEAVNPDQIKADKDALKANPTGWFGRKGGGLSRAVRDLAGSDSDAAGAIVSAHKGSGGGLSREQASAIGAGLGQAVLACKDFTDEAGKIQTAASSSSEDALVASFNSTIGSAQTGAVGGGAGGAAGGGGDGTGIGGATAQAATPGGGGSGRADPGSTAPVANRFVSLLTSVPGASASATTPGTTAASTTTTINTTTIQAGQAATTNP